MSLIYEPKGKAREYSPLALNVYSGGCDHACRYCYCTGMQKAFGRTWDGVPVTRDISGLAREAAKRSRQILMCFVGDPYCEADVQHGNTREALTVLRAAGCSVAILTKGGKRCLRDLNLFLGWPGGRIKVGATLTFNASALSREWEPGAADPGDRIDSLRELHAAGIKTWVSIEPVIVASESLAMIEASLPYADAYKVGRWNHDNLAHEIDWPAFAKQAVNMIRAAGKALYVKIDLRKSLPNGFLTASEIDAETLTLPDRE